MDKAAILKQFKLTASDLARRIGVTKSAVSQWGDEIPPERVLSICSALCWKLTPHQIRPDLYPNPTDGLPQKSQRKKVA
jgi:DNA-binding transcriptional regulator YdaS (Cro superfamily)